MRKDLDPEHLRQLVQCGMCRPQVATALGISLRTLNYRIAASGELRAAATPKRRTALPPERPVMTRCRVGDWRAIRRVSVSKTRASAAAQLLQHPAASTSRPGTKQLAIDLQFLAKVLSQGATLQETAAALVISRATLLRRRRTSTEVRHAVEEGFRLRRVRLSDARLALAESGHWPAARLSMLIRVGWIEAGFGIRGASGALNYQLRAIYSQLQD